MSVAEWLRWRADAMVTALGVSVFSGKCGSNGFVGEVRWMIAAMMGTAISASMVTVMSMCCINGDSNCVVSMVTTM